MSDETGNQRIGDYEILGVLGTGGMGRVFKVRNVLSDRIEAMKVLLPDLAGQEELAERFRREIKVLAGLDHPNIAALRTALTVQNQLINQLIMIMEYVEGETLAKRLERGPLPVPDATNYIDQVLSALSYAHQKQVIHRDIKPSNMMLTPQGVVKVMDFGIARSEKDRNLTMTGTTLGSLYYMSPEQVKGEHTDARSDLYSVGVSFYEMVTGQRPFEADVDYAILLAHIQKPPTPPIEIRKNLPPALNDIILTAMEKDPAQRFQSANSFRTALKSVQAGVAGALSQVAAPPPATPQAIPSLSPTPDAETAAFTSPPSAPASNAPGVQPPPVLPPVGHYGGASAPSGSSGHRGLWMGLGAFVVLVVLVAAGLYVPRWVKARAGEPRPPRSQAVQGSQSPTPAVPATTTAPAPDVNAAGSRVNVPPPAPPEEMGDPSSAPAQPATTQPTPPSMANVRTHSAAREVTTPASRRVVESPPQESTPPASERPERPDAQTTSAQAQDAADAMQLEQVEKEFDQVSSRSNAVASSLDTLQREQASQGLNLRGDIAASHERLNTYLGRAQAAMQSHDAKTAQKYLDLAEPELEKLEKFLGR